MSIIPDTALFGAANYYIGFYVGVPVGFVQATNSFILIYYTSRVKNKFVINISK